MKKTLAVQLEFDIKTIRRVVAIVTGDSMSDEEILAKFVDREIVKVDVEKRIGENEALSLCAAFAAIIIQTESDQP